MKLTELGIKKSIRQAQNQGAEKKVFDGYGLFLLIRPSGSASWKWNYRNHGKQKTLTIGSYPLMTLGQARQKHLEARQLLENGQDPCNDKQERKLKRKLENANTFEHVAREWHTRQLPRWQPAHARKVWDSVEKEVFPHLGEVPIADIKAPAILTVIRNVERRGVGDTAARVLQRIHAVFNYAVQTGYREDNPAAYLAGIVIKKPEQHMPALHQDDLPEFFRRLKVEPCRPENRIALLLQVLTFVRSGTLRQAEWVEIDQEKREWRIPKDKMKGRKDTHIVPLSDWALQLLDELHLITGESRYLFPNARDAIRPMSANAVCYLMNRMGYKDIATPHGFRSLATDVLNENNFNSDWVERQMAHVERNRSRKPYHRTEYLEQRHNMMQWYSDWLKERFQAALGEGK